MPRLIARSLTAQLLALSLNALMVCLTVTSRIVWAQERQPSREPMLRIETGMHTATIKRIGVDRAGKFLVTASDDKTARVWELQTGRLLRVLRVPVGDGNEGKLYAAAISPDGNTIATGGWTSNGEGNVESVYLFDRESGRLMRRLTGLPNVVFHLAFSPDGVRLAATLGGTNGVRMWGASEWGEVARDTAYGARSYGADFDRAGRLVTSCYDGSVRLYDRAMRLLAKQAAPGGKQAFAVRFSPDGRKVAVGYSDSTRVDVLNAETLALLYSADTAGINNGDMSSVAWSTDGTMLYAGGKYQDKGGFLIRRWSDAGRGRYVDTSATTSTIFDIAPLPTGGIVYGTGEPSWGILDAQHKQTQPPQAGQISDYRDNQTGFLTDGPAGAIRFGYEPFGRSPAVFQLSDRTLMPGAPTASDMRPPRTDAPGLSVTDWKYTYTPRLNNTPLKLDQYERSRSLAIAPDGERFLLGTNYWIRLFNRSGQEVWKAPIPDVAWAVNISGDGRLALAAYGDGTIRWYRLTDGKELLAFFPHKDRKRWILWTPSGYYDASPGAEELIGWHVNNGRDQAADFFPVGQFRSTYYRPDVIAKVLQTGDEARALALANGEAGEEGAKYVKPPEKPNVFRMLPPVVEIVSPSDNTAISTTEVTLRFRVRIPSGEPITKIEARVDGRPASATKELVQQGTEADVHAIRVSVPARDSGVSIIAENRYAPSVPATVRLKWTGATVVSTKPTLYVLAVGVSRYANEKYNLQFADKDADDFVRAMKAQKGLQYQDVVVYRGKAVTNESAKKDEIEGGLDWISKTTTSNDVAMVFFSGHGLNNQSNYYFFCPYNIDPGSLYVTGVPFSDIKNAVSAVRGKVLFFVDSCHSGNSLGTGWRRDMNILINELSSAPNGVLVISATTSGELAFEVPDLSLGMLQTPQWNNGAFTKAVLEGINGAAESRRTGRITYASLVDYVTDRVVELTNNHQHPSLGAQGGQNLPIALKQ